MSNHLHFAVISVLAGALILFGSMATNLSMSEAQAAIASQGGIHHIAVGIACKNNTEKLTLRGIGGKGVVRGLSTSVPELPGIAKNRTVFNGNGNFVAYEIDAPAEAIHKYYSQKLPSHYCWKQVGESDNGLAFRKGDEILFVSSQSLSGSQTAVGFMRSAVLGDTTEGMVRLAQYEGGTPLPPSDSGSYSPPPPSGDSGSYTPPPSGTYQPPSGTYVPPPGDQYQPPSGSPYPGGQYPSTGQYQPQPYSGQPYPSNTNQPMPGPYPSQPYPGGQSYPSGQGQYPQPYSGQSGQPGATCRVNGVEMPGPCTNYGAQNQQFGPGNNNQGMPGGIMDGKFSGPQGPGMQYGQGQQGFGEGQMGPGGDQQQFQQQMEERMNQERLDQIKRGINDFSKGVKQMKKGIGVIEKKLKTCGAKLPIELMNALSAADGVIEKLKAVENPEDFDPTDLEDIGSLMQEWGPRMGDLTRICGMLKQADRELKNFERTIVRYEQKDKANKKLDLSELIAGLKEEVAKLKEVLAQVKELAKSEPDTALETLEDAFFGQMDNIRTSQNSIEMAFNVTQGLKDAARELTNFGRQISALKKRKIDPSEAESLLATLKSQTEELRQLVASKSFDPDELVDKVEAAFATREQLSDTIQQLGGGNTFVPNIKGDSRYNVNFKLPEGFERSGGPQGMGEQGGFGAPSGSLGPSF